MLKNRSPIAESRHMLSFDPERILTSPECTGGDVIGSSREGRSIAAWRFGRGALHVSLIGGCHADEPVGPWMLRRLAGYLGNLPPDDERLSAATWNIVPHVNPDGEERNRAWFDQAGDAFDVTRYARHVVRELPGDDIEYCFPRYAEDTGARPENLAVAAFLTAGAPYHLHVTFHGMGVAKGPWFLLERSWAERSAPLQDYLIEKVAQMGYGLHDVDRGGEKGFHRIAEGFCSRPDSRAMQQFFLERGDTETAAKFRPSSMEFIRALGGDPLTLVSEMPLFIGESRDQPGPPMPIRDQQILQIEFLNAGLELVR